MKDKYVDIADYIRFLKKIRANINGKFGLMFDGLAIHTCKKAKNYLNNNKLLRKLLFFELFPHLVVVVVVAQAVLCESVLRWAVLERVVTVH